MSIALPGPLVDVDWLATHLADPDLCLLDASVVLPAPAFDGDYRASSGQEAWRAARIPGARHADLLEALAEPAAPFSFALPSVARLRAGLQALGLADGRTAVLYDHSDGFWAARLWWMLRSLGVTAAVLDGGLKAWRAAGLPVASGEPAAPASGPLSLPPAYRPGYWVDRAGVEALVRGEAPGTLVCALSAGLFDGSAVTRYSRRGRIPNSRNLPARQLFDADGRYLRGAALEAALAEFDDASAPLVLYCGGGISAAAIALALTLLDRAPPALYDGSLQEWSADPSLPMTTGAAPV
ncbi:MAG: 3-mercaptopyruvate sulfurtransferase [Pseudomonas citronellolis]|nr:MAG: 3-mercaptopyruvate sulfurtransferase [Pseudomonas citronellolis]